MFIIYKFEDNEWVKYSEHTQLIDAEVQKQRCVTQGDSLENLKIVQE